MLHFHSQRTCLLTFDLKAKTASSILEVNFFFLAAALNTRGLSYLSNDTCNYKKKLKIKNYISAF